MASAMDVDDEEVELPTSSSSKGEKKRFEVKKVVTLTYNIKKNSLIMSQFSVECCCFVGLG